MKTPSTILADLAQVLAARRGQRADKSYVASLYQSGIDRILQKVGEEACELVIAGKNPDDSALINEMADLWFHCMVLLEQRQLSHTQVLAELERRFGLSGIDEKNSRQ